MQVPRSLECGCGRSKPHLCHSQIFRHLALPTQAHTVSVICALFAEEISTLHPRGPAVLRSKCS